MHDVVVIGCGIAGTATTVELARRGRRVLPLDALGAGHEHGSSHDDERIVRLSHVDPSRHK